MSITAKYDCSKLIITLADGTEISDAVPDLPARATPEQIREAAWRWVRDEEGTMAEALVIRDQIAVEL